MVTVYVFPGAWGLLSMSPFASKMMAWLKLSGIPHEVKPADPRRAPNGKVPYVRYNGQLIGDTSRIQAALTEAFDVQMDAGLTDAQRTTGHLLQRTLEESLYWVLVYCRWFDDAGWAHMQAELKKIIPAFVFPLASRMVRKKALNQVNMQGTALLGKEGALARGKADLDAVSALLGDQPFVFGDAPTSYDAMLYAFVATALRSPNPHALSQHAQGLSNLCAFVERIEARFAASA